MSDQLTDGRRFRMLTVVDDCTRECIALIADISLSGARVARELATLFDTGGKLQMVVSENGTEFTSNAILKFVDDQNVYFHPKVSRFFHREVSHLQVMFLSSCWRQDISWVLPFSGHSG